MEKHPHQQISPANKVVAQILIDALPLMKQIGQYANKPLADISGSDVEDFLAQQITI